MTMPAGNYYIGDLCYVLHEEWEECCDLFTKGRTDHGCNEGEFTLKDGRRFACFNTAYGDGSYPDQYNRWYGVDSGSIGCILLSDVDVLNTGNFIREGHVVYFPDDFEVSSKGGVLHFGSVSIDTRGGPDEDEDEDEDITEDWYDDGTEEML